MELSGAHWFFGLTTPTGEPRSPEQFAEFLGQQHMQMLLAVVLAISAVVRAFHAAYGFKAARERDGELLSRCKAIPYLSREQSSPI
jgi:hypothetical protein